MKRHSAWPIVIRTMAVLCLLAVMLGTVLAGTGIAMDDEQSGTNLTVTGTVLPESVTERAAYSLHCKYYNEKDFMSSVIGKTEARTEGRFSVLPCSIAGGVVPHHLLADKMIAEFFQTLSYSSPETVVVIAPNHKRVGMNGIHTSTLSWGTAFGVLESDQLLTEMLVSDFKASQSTTLMEEEHSISSLVPYIKYYLPNTKIVPILLHGNYTVKDSQELGERLAEALSDNKGTSGNTSLSGHSNIAIVASVDFSHYLDEDTADKMDVTTLAAIQSNDIVSISMMGNDNLDSPPSIMVLMRAMEKAGIAAPEILAHSNSSNITGTGSDYTTSYYTLLYRY